MINISERREDAESDRGRGHKPSSERSERVGGISNGVLFEELRRLTLCRS